MSPTPRDRRRPPVLAYHSSPRRGPPTDNESRNSPGLPARRFLSVSPLQSVDQTKESEKRPTTSEFQGPLAPIPPSPSLFAVCLFSLFLISSPPPLLPKNASLVYSVYGYLRATCRPLSLSLSPSRISMLPSPARELYSGIPGICLDNAPWLARYSALFYAVRGALAAAPLRS